MAEAQLATADAFVGGQMVIQIVKTEELINNAIVDLAAYSHLADIMAVIDDAQRLRDQFSGLASRMITRIAYWTGLEIPYDMHTLNQFRINTRQICDAASMDALGAQSTLRDLMMILTTVTRIIQSVGSITGSVGGHQSLHGPLGSLNNAIIAIGAMQSGMHEATLCQQRFQQVERQSVEAIMATAYDNWGAYTPPR